jgi:hypothetical protein
MSPKLLAVIKSYARGVLVAITPLIVINETNIKAYLIAVLAGVISPALRAMDKKDPAFGTVADIVDLKVESEKSKLKKTK